MHQQQPQKTHYQHMWQTDQTIADLQCRNDKLPTIRCTQTITSLLLFAVNSWCIYHPTRKSCPCKAFQLGHWYIKLHSLHIRGAFLGRNSRCRGFSLPERRLLACLRNSLQNSIRRHITLHSDLLLLDVYIEGLNT